MEKFNEVKTILKSGNYNIVDLIKRFLHYTDNINESDNNIAYVNKTCKNVNSARRKKLNTVDNADIGEIHICRKSITFTKETVQFQVKLNYKIVKIEGDFYITKYNDRRYATCMQ